MRRSKKRKLQALVKMIVFILVTQYKQSRSFARGELKVEGEVAVEREGEVEDQSEKAETEMRLLDRVLGTPCLAGSTDPVRVWRLLFLCCEAVGWGGKRFEVGGVSTGHGRRNEGRKMKK